MAQPSAQDPDMRAAEYVLGTLSADEAAQVAHALTHDHDIQIEVAYWEEQLGQLGLALAPVDPPPEAWAMIHAQIDAHQPARKNHLHAPHSARPRRRSRLWQGLAAAASVAAIILAGLLYVETRPVTAPTPTYASIFYDQSTSTGWLLTASPETGKMSVQAVGNYPLPTGKELRLWIIPDGGQPIASGIVPAEGTNDWAMSPRVAKLLRNSATVLAVTLETIGRPLTDGPGGPVMWTAPIRQPS